MGLHEIRGLANALGIENTEEMDVDRLIRSIQFEKGLMPCFSEVWSSPCRVDECPFFFACSSNVTTRVAVRH